MFKGYFRRLGWLNDSDVLFVLALCAVMLVGAGVLVGIMMSWTSYQCSARWSDYQPQYSIVTGCTVQSDHGGRIPATNFMVR